MPIEPVAAELPVQPVPDASRLFAPNRRQLPASARGSGEMIGVTGLVTLPCLLPDEVALGLAVPDQNQINRHRYRLASSVTGYA